MNMSRHMLIKNNTKVEYEWMNQNKKLLKILMSENRQCTGKYQKRQTRISKIKETLGCKMGETISIVNPLLY